MILEWNKSSTELIALNVLNVDLRNSLWSHLRAIVALDHSRLGVEKKTLGKQTRSNFLRSTSLLKFTTSCQQIWVRANQPFIPFYTSRLRRKSTMRRCFYHTDLVQNAVFHNISRPVAFIQYSGPSKHARTFSETVQKISKII